MKKILHIFLLISFIILFVACKEQQKEYLITGPDSVEAGCAIKLETNFENPDDVLWNSSDERIASVLKGMVIAYQEGEVIIKATYNDVVLEKKIIITCNIIDITITGANALYVGQNYQFSYHLSKEVEDIATWSSSDENILLVDEFGIVTALKEGTAKVIVEVLGNTSEFEVEVSTFTLSLVSQNKVQIGTSFDAEVITNPADLNISIKYKSSNEDIFTVDELGKVTGISEGKAVLTAYCESEPSIRSSMAISVVNYVPLFIKVTGDDKILVGEHGFLEAIVTGDGSHEVVWSSTNPEVAICYQGIVLGLQAGETTIYAKSTTDRTVYGNIKIEIAKKEQEEINKEDLARVNKIIDEMSLSQKVGQMFVVGFSGTTMSDALALAIKEYNFGNVIYMGANVSNPTTILQMSNDIQTKMVLENTVPGFISIDQEGGRVARLTNGGTHFISQMAMAATNDYNNTYLETKAIGLELRSYGINADFAPVLDVNNNANNPVIGIRSYGDDPVLVSLFGNNAIKGFKESNVMGTSKHFPGHGNTAVDSHYGLPEVNSSLDELYSVELAPFIASIANGIDAIMTTHIMFKAIDSSYPATLSKKVLTDLLRDTLGFNGIIITDGMEMDAIDKNFGGYDEAAVLAVKAGVDILTYTSLSSPKIAYDGIMRAIDNGEITEERINESVKRILLKKLRYGILDDYIAEEVDRNELLEANDLLNRKFATESLTLVKGDFKGLDKTKSTLIISPSTNFSLGTGLISNSFANFASKYLNEKGHNCTYKQVSTNISASDASSILNIASDYDQIVVAFSNVKTNNYSRTSNFVKELTANHQNVIVIALDTPYDLLSYDDNVKNYICVYGYQKATVEAIASFLNGEYEAKGVLPINNKLFE